MEGLKRFGLVLGNVCVLLMFGLITGCASTPDYKYYRLQAEIPEQTAVVARALPSIGLEPVVLPVWMDSELLAWNEGAYNIRRLEFDRWGGEPQELINQTLSENLSHLIGDREVTIGPWFAGNRPDLVVALTIQNLSFANNSLTLQAVWHIKDKSRKTVVVSKKYTDTVAATLLHPISGKPLAQGFSKLLANLSRAVIKQLPNKR